MWSALIEILLHKVTFEENELAYQVGETTEILSRGRLCATPHCVKVLYYKFVVMGNQCS
jgi:hypothetical protein